ncbi:MBL fold metallo-hydrolase [Enterobacteriaceae endosymbiont of Donacia cincticornis]|uniref:MBL fold metallo-hydrolase n=1 Tax=Enterobacteriaceae endosymbiont of Donacia cincticornis TaxID=2675773 RepID=UPI0014498853|nr:MBL fold metallo-hydrolase [Enterobacteriaceae endosymbiont of Donacia cincticornis]QJC36167.1 MBL fold metallo-hydrolase [Enterobacteriaceae endosymbiont of Donacia cincticornis]
MLWQKLLKQQKSMSNITNMRYKIISVTDFYQNCYLIWCKKTFDAALVDPGGEYQKILNVLKKYKLKIRKILITHCHLDHIGAAYILSKILSIPILGPHKHDIFWLKNIKLQSKLFNLPYCVYKNNIWLKNNQNISIGKINFKIYHCPGHTPGHIVFFNRFDKMLISGDTIFKNSIGRTDLPKSNFYILKNSIKKIFFFFKKRNITILPGHGEKTTSYREIKNNIYLK